MSSTENRSRPRSASERHLTTNGYDTQSAQHHTERYGADQWQPLIDPLIVLGGIFRSKLLICLMAVLGACLGVAIALSTPKSYSVSTDLIVDPRELKIVDRDLNQSTYGADAALALIENQMRIMTSGNVMNGVVDKLKLDADPEFNGQGGATSPIGMLRALLTKSEPSTDPERLRMVTLNNLNKAINVVREGKSFVVSIVGTSLDPDKAAMLANTTRDAYFQEVSDSQARMIGRATDDLNARLDYQRSEVEQAERKVETFKVEKGIVNAQGRLISDEEILKLNDQLSVARARTSELKARATSTQQLSINQVIEGVLPEQVNSASMAELRGQYSSLRQEADRISVRLGPKHPQRQAVEVQLAGAREQIANELRRITSSVQVDLDRAAQLEKDLQAQLTIMTVRQGELSGVLVSLRELERDAASKRAVYESYLLRARETGEQQNINTVKMDIISLAQPPIDSDPPSRSSMAIMFTILGLAAGIGIGLLRGLIDSVKQNGVLRAEQRNRPLVQSQAAEAMSEDDPIQLETGRGEAVIQPLQQGPWDEVEEPRPVEKYDWEGEEAAAYPEPSRQAEASHWQRQNLQPYPPLDDDRDDQNAWGKARKSPETLRFEAWHQERLRMAQRMQAGSDAGNVDDIRRSLRDFQNAVDDLASRHRTP